MTMLDDSFGEVVVVTCVCVACRPSTSSPTTSKNRATRWSRGALCTISSGDAINISSSESSKIKRCYIGRMGCGIWEEWGEREKKHLGAVGRLLLPLEAPLRLLEP